MASEACNEDNLLEVLSEKSDSLHHCYDKELQLNPSLAGQLEVSWTVAPRGVPTSVSAGEGSVGSERVAGCLERAFKKMRFERREKKCPASYTFEFSEKSSK